MTRLLAACIAILIIDVALTVYLVAVCGLPFSVIWREFIRLMLGRRP